MSSTAADIYGDGNNSCGGCYPTFENMVKPVQ